MSENDIFSQFSLTGVCLFSTVLPLIARSWWHQFILSVRCTANVEHPALNLGTRGSLSMSLCKQVDLWSIPSLSWYPVWSFQKTSVSNTMVSRPCIGSFIPVIFRRAYRIIYNDNCYVPSALARFTWPTAMSVQLRR